MPKKNQKIMVIGCQGGGINAAREARRASADAQIVVLDRRLHPPFSVCSLHHLVSGLIDAPGRLVTSSPEELLTQMGIRLILGAEAVGGCAGAGTLEASMAGKSETFRWDSLIIATGSRPRVPLRFSDAARCPNFHTLRTIEDALEIRGAMTTGRILSVVVVGAGSIGAGLAEAAAGHGHRVTIVEASDRFLGIQDSAARTLALQGALRAGIDVILREGSASPVILGGLVRAVGTSLGEIPCDLLLVAAGVEPVTGPATALGVPLGTTGAIRVDKLQRTGRQGIFAAGDCCETFDFIRNRHLLTSLASVAARQGRVAGRNAAAPGSPEAYPGTTGLSVWSHFGVEGASCGIADPSDPDFPDGNLCWVESEVRSTGLPGKDEKIAVQLTFQRSTGRLRGMRITGAPGAALRANHLALAVSEGVPVERLAVLETGYTPALSPLWDPVVSAARKASREV